MEWKRQPSQANQRFSLPIDKPCICKYLSPPPPPPHTPPLVHKLFEGGKVMLVVRTQFSIKFVLVVVEHCCKLVIFWWTCLKVMITWTPV